MDVFLGESLQVPVAATAASPSPTPPSSTVTTTASAIQNARIAALQKQVRFHSFPSFSHFSLFCVFVVWIFVLFMFCMFFHWLHVDCTFSFPRLSLVHPPSRQIGLGSGLVGWMIPTRSHLLYRLLTLHLDLSPLWLPVHCSGNLVANRWIYLKAWRFLCYRNYRMGRLRGLTVLTGIYELTTS